MLFVDEALAQLLNREIKFEADHQPFAAHFFDLRESAEFVKQVLPDGGRIFDELLPFDDVEHGQSTGAREVIPSEGGA